MIDRKRLATPPGEHIRNLFRNTRNGKLSITYYPDLEEPFNLSYRVDWKQEDAENLAIRFEAFIAALNKIGGLYDELNDEICRKRLLTVEEEEVWETYIRPYDSFEVDLFVIRELFLKSEYNELDDEENALLERHNAWLEQQSSKRLGAKARSPKYLINRAQRYARLVSLGAPEIVQKEEARCLAEEMVLYYYSR